MKNISINPERISTVLEREFTMVRSLTVLWIVVKNSIDSKYVPKSISLDKCYPVIAEKTVKYSNQQGKENEELSFGVINDVDEIVYIASYNCKVYTKFMSVTIENNNTNF